MKLIDAHTHLNTKPLVQDWQWYIQKFIDAGGVALVNSWADEEYNLKGIEIAKQAQSLKLKAQSQKYPLIIKATVGWHPLECVEWVVTAENISDKMQWLKKLYIDNKEHVVAIGETGIDLHYLNWLETLEIQKILFIEHCEFARETWLPLVVHSRDAFEQTLEILKDYVDLTIYFHCRWYWSAEIKKLKDYKIKRLFIGFCWNVTYKKAEELRASLKLVPLDQLLLETDAPYLSPQVVRGETNHPANVRYIYDFVSEYLDMSPDVLSKQILSNFLSIYKV